MKLIHRILARILALTLIATPLVALASPASEDVAADSESPFHDSSRPRGPFWVAGAYGWVGKPEAVGAELALAAQFRPIARYGLLLVGPKIGGFYARGMGGANRFDLSWGIQETTWFVNAIGTGIDLEVVSPSTITGESSGTHFRITPNASIRWSRFRREGAWAVRLGLPYDTHYKWGIQAGLSLQLNGIPSIGDAE